MYTRLRKNCDVCFYRNPLLSDLAPVIFQNGRYPSFLGWQRRAEVAAQLVSSYILAKTSESFFDRDGVNHSEQILPSRQQRITPRGDDRAPIIRARQAAEALFTPKPPPVSARAVPESLSPTDGSPRKPRVLPILSPAAPLRHEGRETPSPEPKTMRVMPRSQFGRIRTLVKYGMTVAQIATVYGVAAAEVARILRQA